jgi:hypothetical protein
MTAIYCVILAMLAVGVLESFIDLFPRKKVKLDLPEPEQWHVCDCCGSICKNVTCDDCLQWAEVECICNEIDELYEEHCCIGMIDKLLREAYVIKAGMEAARSSLRSSLNFLSFRTNIVYI